MTGDGSYLGSDVGNRSADFPYLKQIAQAADRLGFGGVADPRRLALRGPMDHRRRARAAHRAAELLGALRPGLATPTHWARQAAALDRISNGRFLVNLVAGGEAKELAGDGIFLSHDERYAHAAEFLTIFRRLLAGETVDFDGRYEKVKGARLLFPPVQQPLPVWFGGSSEPAHELAAAQTDVYLTWGEPLDAGRRRRSTTCAPAPRAKGREVQVRPAHAPHRARDRRGGVARRRQADLQLSDEAIALAQNKLTQTDSVGQKRMSALQRGRTREALEIAPNLWAGIGLVRSGAGTALVGDPKTVAARLREYQALGVETVIASGYPHLEEAYKVAELLFPNSASAAAVPEPRLARPASTASAPTSRVAAE